MPGPRIAEPLYITCLRHGCGVRVRVINRYQQRMRKYCSKRCSTVAHEPIMRLVRRKGGLARAAMMRKAVIARVANLTPLEAFRLGYLKGLQSKHRQLKARGEAA